MKIIKTIGKRVALKATKTKKPSKNELILIINPENALECEVIAVSNSHYDDKGKFHKQDLKIGEIILINKKAGIRIKDNQEEYIIVNEDEIQAKLLR